MLNYAPYKRCNIYSFCSFNTLTFIFTSFLEEDVLGLKFEMKMLGNY